MGEEEGSHRKDQEREEMKETGIKRDPAFPCPSCHKAEIGVRTHTLRALLVGRGCQAPVGRGASLSAPVECLQLVQATPPGAESNWFP